MRIPPSTPYVALENKNHLAIENCYELENKIIKCHVLQFGYIELVKAVLKD